MFLTMIHSNGINKMNAFFSVLLGERQNLKKILMNPNWNKTFTIYVIVFTILSARPLHFSSLWSSVQDLRNVIIPCNTGICAIKC